MTHYSTLVRASALYDFILTSAFAVPIVAGLKIDLLRSVHVSLSLSGDFPAFIAMHLMFLNLLGPANTIFIQSAEFKTVHDEAERASRGYST